MDHQDVPSSSSATQREEHVIQVLDTPAFVKGETTGGVPVPAVSRKLGLWEKAVLCVLITLLLLFTAFFTYTIALRVLYDGPIDYSAALTAAAASSPTTTTNTTKIPPLFNLTVHIKDSSRLSAACVPVGTTAAVSYDGGGTVVVGAGAVSAFCAGEMEESEVVVPVWGMGDGADLTLPSELETREAVVDVVIRMPGGRYETCYVAQVLTCAVRVGRGLSPCKSECGH